MVTDSPPKTWKPTVTESELKFQSKNCQSDTVSVVIKSPQRLLRHAHDNCLVCEPTTLFRCQHTNATPAFAATTTGKGPTEKNPHKTHTHTHVGLEDKETNKK
jgi:hypothetical protein